MSFRCACCAAFLCLFLSVPALSSSCFRVVCLAVLLLSATVSCVLAAPAVLLSFPCSCLFLPCLRLFFSPPLFVPGCSASLCDLVLPSRCVCFAALLSYFFSVPSFPSSCLRKVCLTVLLFSATLSRLLTASALLLSFLALVCSFLSLFFLSQSLSGYSPFLCDLVLPSRCFGFAVLLPCSCMFLPCPRLATY